MKIGSGKPPFTYPHKTVKNVKAETVTGKTGEVKKPAVTGQEIKNLTYSQPLPRTDHVNVERLMKETEKNFESLRRIVLNLLERQGHAVRNGQVLVDEQARLEAAALVADDGPLGAEAVSDSIVQFAKAISGGDKSKIGMLREAIIEGFRQAERMLGSLPEVSLRTYDLVMEKLSAWENE